MSNCIFCKIIAGEIPSRKIFENDSVFAILDINPVSRGHLLVIAKKHTETLSEMEEEGIAPLFSAVRRLGRAVQKVTGADGFNVIVNNGPAAGQVIPHTHVHVIPRFVGDGLQEWPHIKLADQEMDELAGQIAGAVG